MKSLFPSPRHLLACATVLLLLASPARAAAGDVLFTVNGAPAVPGDLKPAEIQALVLDNGLLKLTFGQDARQDFSATSVMVRGHELAHNLHGVEPRDTDAHRTFYHDYSASGGYLHAGIVRIVKNTPELAHFAIIDPGGEGRPFLEDHFVMLKGESGVHPYVIIRSPFGGEMRTMYRFDMDILDWTYCGERTGQQPKYAFLQSISPKGNMGDETWKLPDGPVYQKYDYCLYYAEQPVWGHFGHGFGAWFIPVSLESYAGGPLRQELAVHQDALILNYIGGGHFGGGGTAGGRTGEKIHGPWFLYFNTGDTPESLIADARATALAEQKKWPYPWVEEPLYPVKRTTVTGQLKISHDRSAAKAWIVLGQPDAGAGGGGGVPDRASALYRQGGDYIFSVQADADGKFALPAVRPGNYTLYAWQTQGAITQSFARDGVEVQGGTLDLGVVEWDAPYHPKLIFQVGQADRMAGEFKFGHAPRTNQMVNGFPKDLTFTIGKSKEAEDWYFAQQSGVWNINFEVAKVPAGNAYLTIPVAGGPGKVTVLVNGQPVGTVTHRDDASVRRAANRSGVYARFEFTFPGKVLKAGPNTVSLRMEGSSGNNNGMMYDTVVLESD